MSPHAVSDAQAYLRVKKQLDDAYEAGRRAGVAEGRARAAEDYQATYRRGYLAGFQARKRGAEPKPAMRKVIVSA